MFKKKVIEEVKTPLYLDKKILVGLALGTCVIVGGVVVYKKQQGKKQFQSVKDLYSTYYDGVYIEELLEKEGISEKEAEDITNEYWGYLDDLSNAKNTDELLDAQTDLEYLLGNCKYYKNIPILNVMNIDHLKEILEYNNGGVMTDEEIEEDENFVNPLEEMIQKAVNTAVLNKEEKKEEENNDSGNSSVSGMETISTIPEENDDAETEEIEDYKIETQLHRISTKHDEVETVLRDTASVSSPFNTIISDDMAEAVKKATEEWEKQHSSDTEKAIENEDKKLDSMTAKEQTEYLKKKFRQQVADIAVVKGKYLNDPEYVELISQFDSLVEKGKVPPAEMREFLSNAALSLDQTMFV